MDKIVITISIDTEKKSIDIDSSCGPEDKVVSALLFVAERLINRMKENDQQKQGKLSPVQNVPETSV